ncbi:Decaprenyl diphosphate synthase-like protein [Endogone sp. FLAS-F59071]|nr:Decaprenyl diphosphate synthase-like protein [Endogone sp. FLAS-F59071]|eukprot:RUS22306.1 Decaprenyl diphosphate synthase-like protein [Endogone sp. FLAS-F59071]
MSTFHSIQSSISSTLTFAYDACCRAVEQTVINALKQGPIPRHVSFVMDGNRRFAQKINVKTGEGHYAGFKQGEKRIKLTFARQFVEKVLKLCMDLGIDVVTVYAFSIENFKRPKEEVDYLMQLFREKFIELCYNNETVRQYGVQIRFLGNLDLLPPDVAASAREAMEMTKNNTRALLTELPHTYFSRIFNICCPYTGRDEITTAMREIAEGVERGEVKPERQNLDINN